MSVTSENLDWMIDKLENGNSVIYPDGNPALLEQYKERRRDIQATVSMLRMTGFSIDPISPPIPTEFDYEQLKKEYCCGGCGTVFIDSDAYCIQCGVKL